MTKNDRLSSITKNAFLFYIAIIAISLVISTAIVITLRQLGIIEKSDLLVVISLAGSILIPFGIVYIPTRVSKQVSIIHERIQRKLPNDKAVYKEALALLEWVGTESNTSFEYTSATPYFGLFKSSIESEVCGDVNENEWKLILENRLESAKHDDSITTNIYALKWEPFTSGRAALFELSKILSNKCKDKNHRRDLALHIYSTGLKQWRDFISMFQHYPNHKNTRIYISKYQHEVFSFVAQKGSEKRCVFAFVSSSNDEFKMFGTFAKYDMNWISIAENYLNERKSTSDEITHTILLDNRSSDQKNRDHELLNHYTSLSDNFCKSSDANIKNTYSYEFKEGDDKFNYYINKQVFPFNLSKEQKLWARLFNSDDFKEIISQHKNELIGIDINTGCGILAIHLSTFCKKVFATESDSKAMGNALLNYNEYKKCFPNGHNAPISFYCSDNLNFISASIKNSNKPKYIVTLKHLFYKSYFCHMDYKYDYQHREKCANNYITNKLNNDTSYKDLRENFDIKCITGCLFPKENGRKEACLKAGKPQIIHWLESIEETICKTNCEVYVILGVHESLCSSMAFTALFQQYHYTSHATPANADDKDSFLYVFKKTVDYNITG